MQPLWHPVPFVKYSYHADNYLLCSENGTREWHCEVKISALPACTVRVYSSLVLALKKVNCYTVQTLLPKGTGVSLKIMCLVFTLIFPRNIHPPHKKQSLTAHTLNVNSLSSPSDCGLSTQPKQWNWLGCALPNLRTWKELHPKLATFFFFF